jgi:hypothetical protein
MPVILDPNAYDLWLDPGMLNVAAISELLKPFDAGLMKSYPVSTRINHVANDDEGCSAPVEVADTQVGLFQAAGSNETRIRSSSSSLSTGF